MANDQENDTPGVVEPEIEANQAHSEAAQSSLRSAPSSSSGSLSTSQSTTQKCTHCSTVSSDPETKPLKPCPKCKSVFYCSKECLKEDFKKHKKNCAALAQVYAQSANLKFAAPARAPKDGHRGGLQKWQFDT